MPAFIYRALGFVFVMGIGYLLRHRGLVKKEEARIFSTILMNVTLPSALLLSSQSMKVEQIALLPFFLGIVANLCLLVAGYVVWRKDRQKQAAVMVGLSGYNIGTFTLPFVQAFFPASSLATVLLFDAGNAIMVLGGNFSLASQLTNQVSSPGLWRSLKPLGKSLPLLVYLLTLTLAYFSISLPQNLLSIFSIAAQANPFLAMLYLGVLLDFPVSWAGWKELVQGYWVRLLTNFCLAGLVVYGLPFSSSQTWMILLCLLSPISVLAPFYAWKLGGDGAEAANLNSLSILGSLIALFALLYFGP
ncbi:transporter [Streptococcus sp. 29896]|uniref:Transporter n=1 Tax=Streptococcus suivaginalis TaxID=3028082 RepID=A0AA96VGG9_9STRE|nr:AEC family transporter [Streptococcus sp. 29896]WNY47821.1 transporter [Streptococcus sp. 29896]